MKTTDVPPRPPAPHFYGLLSNGRTAALVGRDASVDWLPLPRFDSASVFTRLLGNDEQGFYRIAAAEGGRVASQRYVAGTNVLETEIRSASGRATIRDYLTIGRLELRRLVRSEIPLSVTLHPVYGYGLVAAGARAEGAGAVFDNPLEAEALAFAVCRAGEDPVDGTPACGPPPLGADPQKGVWQLPPGTYELILRYIPDYEREGLQAVDTLCRDVAAGATHLGRGDAHPPLDSTIRFWRDRSRHAYRGPYREALERSLLVLHALTYRTNGAVIAAPTTSLPETIGEGREWDYRFAWVRDGSYAAEALLAAGDVVSARRCLEFFLNCIDLQGKPFRAPFFHVDGTLIRGERSLAWLPGFRESRPCREGNAATHQDQLDIEGDFLWTVYRYFRLTDDVAFIRAYWDELAGLVDWVMDNWTLPDASLWEFRGQDDHYTHSKLMCWVALRYGADLAVAVGDRRGASRWRSAAGRVARAIERNGFNRRLGHYVQTFGGDRVDAALLLLPLYGFCPASGERFQGTLQAIERQLVSGHWVFRYTGDMFGKVSHPFVLATSWLARVCVLLGERERARTLLEGLLASRTDLGLLGEHADIETNEPRGNFPQAFSHLGVAMVVLDLDEAAARPRDGT